MVQWVRANANGYGNIMTWSCVSDEPSITISRSNCTKQSQDEWCDTAYRGLHDIELTKMYQM
jgi:hypothetical protein